MARSAVAQSHGPLLLGHSGLRVGAIKGICGDSLIIKQVNIITILFTQYFNRILICPFSHFIAGLTYTFLVK